MQELTRQFLKERLDATAQGLLNLSTQKINETPHVFIGFRFYSAGVPVTPSGGTCTFTAQPEGMDNFIAIIDGTDIDVTAALPSLSFAENIAALAYDPTSIVGADEVEITVKGNYA